MKRWSAFDWLDIVRNRPLMFVPSDSELEPLEALLNGYQMALDVHGLDLDVPSFGRPFLDWVYEKTRWSTESGWAQALREEAPKGKAPLAYFFEFADAYRTLKPTVVARIRERELVQYRPEPYFLLRSHADNAVVLDALRTESGRFFMTKREALELARRITPAAARRPSRSRA